MNQQKAKALRGMVREMVAKGIIKGEEWCEYGHVNHRKTVQVFEKNKETDEVEKKSKEVFVKTVMINPNSPKGVYRRMKKHGAAKVIAGLA